MQAENFLGMASTDQQVKEDKKAEREESCPPNQTSCPGSTCCGIGPDAVCCPDGETCCPAGTECIGDRACLSKSEKQPEPLIEVQMRIFYLNRFTEMFL